MLIYMNLTRDYEALVTQAYVEAGGKGASEVSTQSDLLAMKASRQVPQRKYRVHESKAFQKSPYLRSYAPAINQLKKRLQGGESISYALSKQTGNVDCFDRLLAYYGINHLHLVLDGERDANGFVKARSEILLFFVVQDSDFYFIDLVLHPKKGVGLGWILATLPRTLKMHWPELCIDVGPTLHADSLSDEIRAMLEDKGVNAPIDHSGGSFLPKAGIVSGKPNIVGRRSYVRTVGETMVGHRVRSTIEALQLFLWNRHEQYFPSKESYARMLSLEFVDAEQHAFGIYDSLSRERKSFSLELHDGVLVWKCSWIVVRPLNCLTPS